MTDYSKLSLLVVDDTDFVVAMIVRILERIGIGQITTASDGDEAIALFKEPTNHFDIMICDLDMPRVDGVEVLRHLSERQRGMGVIISSGVDARLLKTVSDLAANQGVHLLGTIPKPIRESELLPLLERREITLPLLAAARMQAPITVQDLRQALTKGELTCLFQPRLDMASTNIVGAEVLVRWWHGGKGLLLPDDFLSLLDQAGLQADLLEVLLDQALPVLVKAKEVNDDFQLSLNLPASALRIDLPDYLRARLQAHGLKAGDLRLELADVGQAIDDIVKMDVLSRLRLRGFGLSIDRFGQSDVTAKQVAAIPADEIKIDPALIAQVTTSRDSRVAVQGAIDLVRELRLRVAAVGIETDEQWELLDIMGVDSGQGHVILVPTAGPLFLDWLRGQMAKGHE